MYPQNNRDTQFAKLREYYFMVSCTVCLEQHCKRCVSWTVQISWWKLYLLFQISHKCTYTLLSHNQIFSYYSTLQFVSRSWHAYVKSVNYVIQTYTATFTIEHPVLSLPLGYFVILSYDTHRHSHYYITLSEFYTPNWYSIANNIVYCFLTHDAVSCRSLRITYSRS